MLETIQRIFGIDDREAKLFLYLLEHGADSVGNIAKKVGIERVSVYGYLEKLQLHGLVIQSQKNNKKVFAASSKESIDRLIFEKQNNLDTGKRALEQLFISIATKGVSINPKFQLFEGKAGVQFVLKDMLLYRGIETQAYWPIKSMIKILSAQFFKEHNKERIRRKIYTRAIWPEKYKVSIADHPYLGAGKGFFREIKIAPKDIAFTMGYWIYGNKVACISSEKEMFGFILESKEFADMLRSQFEFMWKYSRSLNCKYKESEEFLYEIIKGE